MSVPEHPNSGTDDSGIDRLPADGLMEEMPAAGAPTAIVPASVSLDKAGAIGSSSTYASGGVTLRRLAAPAIGLVGFFAFWQAVSSSGLVQRALLPAPSDLPDAWMAEMQGGFWWDAVTGSLGHYFSGLFLGSGLGLLLGTACGLISGLESLLAWVVRVLRPIPGLAWVPFAIIWFE